MAAADELPPPALHFAPPILQTATSTLAGIGTSFTDAVLGRGRRRQRGVGAHEDWEVDSQASERSACSTTSPRGNRRASGPVFVAEHLHWLESQDSKKVCRLKKIHKLGFDSANSLREYFEQWGPVERVLLSNVPVDCQAGPPPRTNARARPAGMGWVVMGSADDATRVLAHPIHVVQDVQILVLPYIPKTAEQRQACAEGVIEEEA